MKRGNVHLLILFIVVTSLCVNGEEKNIDGAFMVAQCDTFTNADTVKIETVVEEDSTGVEKGPVNEYGGQLIKHSVTLTEVEFCRFNWQVQN